MQGSRCAAIQAVRSGRHCLGHQRSHAKCQAGVVRKRGHTEQSAAAAVLAFAIRAGLAIRLAAVVVMVMVNGPVRMGMRQTFVFRRRARCAQLIKAVERGRAGGDHGGRRQDTKSIGQRDQDCRPGPEAFRQITHRGLGTDFNEPSL